MSNEPKIDRSNYGDFSPNHVGEYDLTKVSDEYLQKCILYIWSISNGNFKYDAVSNLLVAETNRRASEQSRISNEKTGKIGFFLSVLALIISIASFGIAYFDYKSGNQWQKEETILLNKQIEILKSGISVKIIKDNKK